jgi:poly-gamma-glutamate synthesis protein (capsule biosynthesis protein)
LFSSNRPPIADNILLVSDPDVVNGLNKIGVNIVSVANNHAFDYGLGAFAKTKETLENNGIKCVGGGRNIAEASLPVICNVNGLRFCFLAYGSREAYCRQIASDDSYGINVLDPDKIYEDIQKIKTEVDFIVIYFHWGKEFHDYPSPLSTKIARELIDSGASIVAGCHAHVLQGYEKYKNGLIIYDLGSLVFGDIVITKPIKYNFNLKKRKHRESILVDCLFGKDGLINYSFTPILINSNFQAVIPKGSEGSRIVNRFQKQSNRIVRGKYERFHLAYQLKLKIIRFFKSRSTIIKRFFRFFHNRSAWL